MAQDISTGQVAISDVRYALKLMSDAYKASDLRALIEYLANSVEAGAKNIWLLIYSVGKVSYILIEDNGKGISGEELGRIPKKICDSVKRGDTSVTGQHGIGMPTAAIALGASLIKVVSRAAGMKETFVLEFPLEGDVLRYTVRPAVGEEIMQRQGTKVFLHGIPDERLSKIYLAAAKRKREGKSRMAEYFARSFAIQLGKRELMIEIERKKGRNTEKECIRDIAYQGPQIMLPSITTAYGTAEFRLHLGKGGIVVQGATAPLTTELQQEYAEFSGPPLSQFEGVVHISTGMLDRTGGGIAKNKKMQIFVDVLRKEIYPLLEKFYTKVVREGFGAAEATKLRDALLTAIKTTGVEELPRASVISKEGEEVIAARSDLGGERGRQKEKGKGRQPYADLRPRTRAPLQGRFRPQGVAFVRGLKWDLEPLEGEEKSKIYVEDKGSIRINTGHSNYAQWISPEGESLTPKEVGKRKLLYMAMITCWVIANHETPHEVYGVEEWRATSDRLFLIVQELLN